MNVSLAAVFANIGVLGVLFAAKMVPKLGLVYPLGRRHARENATFMTLLMSTGLTFGTDQRALRVDRAHHQSNPVSHCS